MVGDSKQSASDYWAIRAGPQWYETASSPPQTTGLSGQALSGTRQQADRPQTTGLSGQARQWCETVSSQPQTTGLSGQAAQHAL